jgi:coenzyme F420-reducing hydrogenase beta subunit
MHIETLVEWRHPLGEAHCLGRFVGSPSGAEGVVVLSEVADNDNATGLSANVGGAATAFVQKIADRVRIDSASVLWITHHGDFSSVDAWGSPETFTRVEVSVDKGRLREDMRRERRLGPQEVRNLIVPLGLRPVTEVLGDLRSSTGTEP